MAGKLGAVSLVGTTLADGTEGGKVGAELLQTLAGERQISSAPLSYVSVKEDWNYTIVDLSVDSTVVSDAPTIVGNIWVETVMSAHTVAIADDTVTVKTLEASSAVGTSWEQLKGLRCETNLTVTPNISSTGIIHVLWRLM